MYQWFGCCLSFSFICVDLYIYKKKKKTPYSLRHRNIEIRPINNPTMASKCSSERKSHTPFTLNEKLEMIKHSEESKSKVEIVWDFLGGPWLRLHAPNAGGWGSISGQETRSHMPQLRVCMLQLKDPACHN